MLLPILVATGSLVASASAAGCVATSYYFGVSFLPSTTDTEYENIYKYRTTKTIYDSTITSTRQFTSFSSSIDSNYIYQLPPSTVTKTKTVAPTKTFTKSCPACLSPTSTTTLSYIRTVPQTKTLTQTFTYDETTVYPRTKKVVKTVTAGNPATTKRVTSTVTQKTVVVSTTFSDFNYFTSYSIGTTNSGVLTKTKTVTKSTGLTASVTITLFSLQLKNDFRAGDTLSFAKDDPFYNHVLVPQSSTEVKWYVEPGTGRLIELASGWHVEETTAYTGEPFIGIAATPEIPPYKDGDFYVGALTNCTAKCGEVLYCNHNNQELDDYSVGWFELSVSGAGKDYIQGEFPAPYTNIGGGAVFVVPPTKGT